MHPVSRLPLRVKKSKPGSWASSVGNVAGQQIVGEVQGSEGGDASQFRGNSPGQPVAIEGKQLKLRQAFQLGRNWASRWLRGGRQGWCSCGERSRGRLWDSGSGRRLCGGRCPDGLQAASERATARPDRMANSHSPKPVGSLVVMPYNSTHEHFTPGVTGRNKVEFRGIDMTESAILHTENVGSAEK